MLPNAQFATLYMERLAEELISVMKHFHKIESWLGINLSASRIGAEKNLMKELDFLFHPSFAESKIIDTAWSEWADALYLSVVDGARDLDFNADQKLLDEYLQRRTLARVAIIPK